MFSTDLTNVRRNIEISLSWRLSFRCGNSLKNNCCLETKQQTFKHLSRKQKSFWNIRKSFSPQKQSFLSQQNVAWSWKRGNVERQYFKTMAHLIFKGFNWGMLIVVYQGNCLNIVRVYPHLRLREKAIVLATLSWLRDKLQGKWYKL